MGTDSSTGDDPFDDVGNGLNDDVLSLGDEATRSSFLERERRRSLGSSFAAPSAPPTPARLETIEDDLGHIEAELRKLRQAIEDDDEPTPAIAMADLDPREPPACGFVYDRAGRIYAVGDRPLDGQVLLTPHESE